MDPLFSCPPDELLTEIPDSECAFRFDQIQRFFFQRIQTTPSFTSTTIKAAATWTPLLSETDDTLIVKTPRMPNVVIPPGEILKEGGNDNTTLDGVPRLNGRGFSGVTLDTQNWTPAQLNAFRKLANESVGNSNIWMYMVNRFGQIISKSDGGGIVVYNIMAGDPGTEGFNKDNIARASFDFPPGWADDLIISNPTAPFNPLTI